MDYVVTSSLLFFFLFSFAKTLVQPYIFLFQGALRLFQLQLTQKQRESDFLERNING